QQSSCGNLPSLSLLQWLLLRNRVVCGAKLIDARAFQARRAPHTSQGHKPDGAVTGFLIVRPVLVHLVEMLSLILYRPANTVKDTLMLGNQGGIDKPARM